MSPPQAPEIDYMTQRGLNNLRLSKSSQSYFVAHNNKGTVVMDYETQETFLIIYCLGFTITAIISALYLRYKKCDGDEIFARSYFHAATWPFLLFGVAPILLLLEIKDFVVRKFRKG